MCADVTSHVKISDAYFRNQDDVCIISTPDGPTIEFRVSLKSYDSAVESLITAIVNTTGTGSLLDITDIGFTNLKYTPLYLSTPGNNQYGALATSSTLGNASLIVSITSWNNNQYA